MEMAHLDPFFISFSWMINIYDFLIKHCHCPIRKRLNYQAPEPLMVNSQLLTTPSIHVNSLQRGTPQVFRCFCEICPSRCLASWMCSPQGHHEPRISRGKWRCHRQKKTWRNIIHRLKFSQGKYGNIIHRLRFSWGKMRKTWNSIIYIES